MTRAEPDANDGYNEGDKSHGSGGEKRTDLAVDRTDMAEDRTIMAVERTFAGWIRTAFASIAIGLGFRALFGELDPPWLARVISSMFIALAIWLALSAASRACKSLERMDTHAVNRPRGLHMRYISWAVAVGAAVLLAGLWFLNDGSLKQV
ncbi:YidH family protein [Parerythrobacter jejuensis]|uniref:DUF202 domain-containing protein n=1 Tax=Parerythrobacter jejuensis TaxID=795812 RepID=A0A845AWF9_9SPHN|nr:DUF202 domain-containing protein [Parerythrobacter jejuensis]MXP30725.1 DUF202 domain-containing protein [Parerythrobacter jejuensis]MXP33485.1 DUF202 domain-containing protein [Parerythrobacter jejuensis]